MTATMAAYPARLSSFTPQLHADETLTPCLAAGAFLAATESRHAHI